MSEIKTITAHGVTYSIKDESARNSVQSLIPKILKLGRSKVIATTKTPSGFKQSQGFAYVEGDVYDTAFVAYNGDATSTIVKYSIDRSSGVITELGRCTSPQLTHANSLAFNGSKIYSLCGLTYQWTADPNMCIIDANTMEFESTINTGRIDLCGIAFVGNTLYGGTTTNTICAWDGEKFNKVCDLTGVLPKGTHQGFGADEDYFYFPMTNPTQILVYNKKGEFVTSKYLGTDEYVYTYHEVEDLAIVGDNIYFNNNNPGGWELKNEMLVNIGVIDKYHDENVEGTRRGDFITSIYVDSKATYYNGDGSKSKPFKSMTQALSYIKSLPDGNITIELTDKTIEGFMLENVGNKFIRFHNGTITGPVLIKGCNVSFYGTTFTISGSHKYLEKNAGIYLSNSYGGGSYNFEQCKFSISCELQMYCYFSSGEINFDQNTRTIDKYVVFNNCSMTLKANDAGFYEVDGKNIVNEYDKHATFRTYIGKGRYAYKNTNITDIGSNNLQTLLGGKLLPGSVLKIAFLGGVGYIHVGGDGGGNSGIFLGTQLEAGELVIYRVNASVSTDGRTLTTSCGKYVPSTKTWTSLTEQNKGNFAISYLEVF